MKCNVCGFDNEPLPGESMGTHCGGCGTRISGGDKPFPGVTVDPDTPERTTIDDDGDEVVVDGPDDPIVVDDDLRDRLHEDYPYADDERIENLLVIEQATYHWGRGIGAEPDGYARDTLTVVRKTDEPCTKCGNDEVRDTDSHGDAGICHSWRVECTRCGNVIDDGFSA